MKMSYKVTQEEVEEIDQYVARFKNYSTKEILDILEEMRRPFFNNMTREEIEAIRKEDEIPLSALEKRFPEYFLK